MPTQTNVWYLKRQLWLYKKWEFTNWPLWGVSLLQSYCYFRHLFFRKSFYVCRNISGPFGHQVDLTWSHLRLRVVFCFSVARLRGRLWNTLWHFFYYHITKGCLSVTHKPTSSGTAPLPHIRINRKMRAWHMNVLCYGMKSHKLSIMWRPIKKATGDMLITTPFMKWDLFIRCYTMSLVQWD